MQSIASVRCAPGTARRARPFAPAQSSSRIASRRSKASVCMSLPPAQPSPAPAPESNSPNSKKAHSSAMNVACNASRTLWPTAAPTAAPTAVPLATPASANPLVELQRLTLQAQAERDEWAQKLEQHELQEQQLRALLDAKARQQAHTKATLATLQHLLAQARHVTREQHLTVFAESVYMCGRQRRSQDGTATFISNSYDEAERRVHLNVSSEAVEQLQHYESSLTRMVGSLVATMAATQTQAPAGPSSLPAGWEEKQQQQQQEKAAVPAPVPAPVHVKVKVSVAPAHRANNIVPRWPSSIALLVQQRHQAMLARAS